MGSIISISLGDTNLYPPVKYKSFGLALRILAMILESFLSNICPPKTAYSPVLLILKISLRTSRDLWMILGESLGNRLKNFFNPKVPHTLLLIVASSIAAAAVAKSCSFINNYVWYM